MDRKQVIIKEIEYWKKSRLLPEHYCNFLLTLYSGQGQVSSVKKKDYRIQLFIIFLTTISLTLFGINFVIFYFTDFSSIMQIGFFTFTIFLLSLLAFYLKIKKIQLFHLFNMIIALVFFIGIIRMVEVLFSGSQNIILLTVASNCLIWILLGFKLKLKYFQISGFIGLILTIILPLVS